MVVPFTHPQLCKLAVNWLKRPHGRGGHGCQVAIDECRTGFGGEIPDAIGYRFTGGKQDGTVLVECKTSRSDFMVDQEKPHRAEGGVGNWRYYMAPEGLISPQELPEKWGLVEVSPRGHIKTVVGPFTDSNYSLRHERLASMWQQSDTAREFFLVVRMLARIPDSENIVDLDKERNRLAFRVNDLANELRTANSRVNGLICDTQCLKDELARYRAMHGELPAVQAIQRLPSKSWSAMSLKP